MEAADLSRAQLVELGRRPASLVTALRAGRMARRLHDLVQQRGLKVVIEP
jgi:hypothetical protein